MTSSISGSTDTAHQHVANNDTEHRKYIPQKEYNSLQKTDLYKTELCRKFMETGSCHYGPLCRFAHGEKELRLVSKKAQMIFKKKKRNELCSNYHIEGMCLYGDRCICIHDLHRKDLM